MFFPTIAILLVCLCSLDVIHAQSGEDSCETRTTACLVEISSFKTIKEAIPWAADFESLCGASQITTDCLDDIPAECSMEASYHRAYFDLSIQSYVCANREGRPYLNGKGLQDSNCATDLTIRENARRELSDCDPNDVHGKRGGGLVTKCLNFASDVFNCIYFDMLHLCNYELPAMYKQLGSGLASRVDEIGCDMLANITSYLYDKIHM